MTQAAHSLLTDIRTEIKRLSVLSKSDENCPYKVQSLLYDFWFIGSIPSLKEVILEEWKKIDLAKCRQLVHSMPRRLGAVIKNHGGHTKYKI